jgi:hypothetical protein
MLETARSTRLGLSPVNEFSVDTKMQDPSVGLCKPNQSKEAL